MDNKLYKQIIKYIKENLIFILIFLFAFLSLNIKLPWSVYSPGGLINIDERLEGEKYTSNGSLNLTYVTFMEGKVPNLLLALILPEWDIIKNDDVKIDNESLIDANNRERIYLKESISNATFIAYNKASKEINPIKEHDYITYIYENAKTNLRTGDEIIEINHQKISSYNDIAKIIATSNFNDKLDLKVIRNNKEHDCYAYVNNIDGDKLIGIAISKINDYNLEPKIIYEERRSESGSSGGLMLTLAIYNSLVEEDITKGLKISGTGTIDLEGNVGAIGGVKYKLSGAVKNKSDIFIVPADNYEEALKIKKKNNYKIDIIKAETFEQVLNELVNYNQ